MPHVVRATQPQRLEARVALDAEEEAFQMEGRDPQVQLFNVSPEMEQKLAPNYDDYLRWKEEQRQERRAQAPDQIQGRVLPSLSVLEGDRP